MGGRARASGALVAAILAIVACPGVSSAQSVARSAEPRPVLGRFGVGAAAPGLTSGDPVVRLRAVDRLGSLGTPAARQALLSALEPGVLRGEARAAAVRWLAPHAADDDVRRALVRELLQPAATRRDGARLPSELPRQVAALALARSGSERALASLGAAVAQGGAPADAARAALLAHPPARLEPLFGRVGARARVAVDGRGVGAPLLALLADLGDARALPILRGALGAASPVSRAEAARALARLGDDAALTLSAADGAGPASAVAAAEARAILGHPSAGAAIAALLRDPATRAEGLRLARVAPDPALAPALGPLLSDAGAPAGEVVAALGLVSGPEASAALERELGRGSLDAAVALGRARGADARASVERGLAGPGRHAVVAALVRALSLGEEVSGLRSRLERLAEDRDPAAAELGVFGLVALGELDVGAALAARPAHAPELAWWGAVARGALARGGRALAALGDAALAREGGVGPVADAARLALLDPRSAARWPTDDLWAACLAGSPAAPLSLRELVRRDDGTLRGRIEPLLRGVDPVVRAHGALGLGDSPDPASVSRLTAIYAEDEDPSVRRAALRALTRRAEPQRLSVLRAARDLDPDAASRAMARAALSGRSVPDPPVTRGDVAVSRVEGTDGATWSARVTRADSLAVPVVVPTGGLLLVPGVGVGEAALALVEPPLAPPAPLARPAKPAQPSSP